MENNLIISYAPHIRSKKSIQKVMLDVLIALLPVFIGAVYFFGVDALIITLTSAAFCVLFEYSWNKFTGKESTTGDLSAIVTGVLLAFTLPSSIPLYMVIVGDAFAIIIVKCFYGGIGQNFINPALAARAFLLACWPVEMTSYPAPSDPLDIFGTVNGTTTATPLAILKNVEGAVEAPLSNLFYGNIAGCIGEVSCLLLLIGAVYLFIKKIINPIIPLTYIITVGLFGQFLSDYKFLYQVLSGGIILAAFFMATDYTTSPVTHLGQFIYALGAGIITGVIRLYGGYPEGVTYAILIMNIVTPLLDKYIKPKKFGSKAVKANVRY